MSVCIYVYIKKDFGFFMSKRLLCLMAFPCPHFYMDTLKSPCGFPILESDIVCVGQPVFILVLPQEIGKAALA